MLGFHAVSEAPLSHAAVAVTAAVSYVDGAVDFGTEQFIVPKGGLSRGRKPELPILNLAHPMSDGLVSALAFYEGGGNVVRDLSSYRTTIASSSLATNSQDAQIRHWDFAGGNFDVGDPVWKIDTERCLDFNSGADLDVVEYSGTKLTSTLNGSNPWSIVWWQKVNSSENGSGRQACLFHNGWNHTAYSGTDKAILIFITGGKIEVDHVGENNTYSDASLTFDAWQQIAVTYDGSTERVYIDGVEKGSASVGALDLESSPPYHAGDGDDPAPLVWGNEGIYSRSYPTRMKLRSTMIYEKALSTNQIKELHVNPYGIYRSTTPIIPASFVVKASTVGLTGQKKVSGVLSLTSTASVSVPDSDMTIAGKTTISSTGSTSIDSAPLGVLISTGPATVTTNGSLSLVSSASVSGSATLASDGHIKLKGEQSFTGSIQLLDPSAKGNTLVMAGAASLTGSAALSSKGSLKLSGAESLSGSATITCNGANITPGVVSLSSAATLTIAPTTLPTGVSVLTGPSTLASNGTIRLAGQAVLSSSATLSSAGSPSVQAVIAITSTGTLSTAGSLTLSGEISASGSGSTSGGSPNLIMRGVLTLGQGAFTNAFGSAFNLTTSRCRVTGSLIEAGAISLSSVATLEFLEGVKRKGVSILTGPSSVSLNGEVLKPGIVSVSGAGTISVDTKLIRTGIISLVNQGSLTSNGVLTIAGISNIGSSAEFSSSGQHLISGLLEITGSATLSIALIPLIPDEVLITLHIDQINILEAFIDQNRTLDSYIFQQLNSNLNVDLQSSTPRYIDQELSLSVER